jgi:hypothetical protein
MTTRDTMRNADRGLPELTFRTPKSLAVLATILSVPFLSFYWMALHRFIPDVVVAHSPNWLTPLSMGLYLPFAFFAYTLFGNVPGYILVTGAGIATAAVGLIRERANKRLRVWLLIVLCSIIAFPLAFRYQPALTAAPGYRMHTVTDPGFLGGIVKASQNITEQTPCTYELLGWSTEHNLYYRATCSAETAIWRYAPAQSDSHTRVANPPAALSASTASEDRVLAMVRAGGVRPERYEPVTRPLLLKSSGLVSPDGHWVAVVTQHVYGTQDVIVLYAPVSTNTGHTIP